MASPPRINGFAVASLVLGLAWLGGIGSIFAVVFGHVALGQIKRSRPAQGGRRLAIAGLVLGYLVIGSVAGFAVTYALGAAARDTQAATSHAIAAPGDDAIGRAAKVPTCLQTLSPGRPGDDFYEAAKESTDAYNDGCCAGGSIDVDGAADESGAARACAGELPASYAGTIMSRAWVNGCLHALGVPDADAPHLLDQL